MPSRLERGDPRSERAADEPNARFRERTLTWFEAGEELAPELEPAPAPALWRRPGFVAALTGGLVLGVVAVSLLI